MGTSIHAHVEVMTHDGVWHHYNAPHVKRDHELFAKMSGVRVESAGDASDLDPVAPIRGVPDDMSAVTRVIYGREEADAHSASYLKRQEIAKLSHWYFTRNPAETPGGYHYLNGVFGYIKGGPLEALGGSSDDPKSWLFADVRIVFWFDC